MISLCLSGFPGHQSALGCFILLVFVSEDVNQRHMHEVLVSVYSFRIHRGNACDCGFQFLNGDVQKNIFDED